MKVARCKPCKKWTFADQADALSGAVRASGKFGAIYRTYPCPKGAGWHLTTKPERETTKPATPEPTSGKDSVMPTDTKPPGWLLPIPCADLGRAEDNVNTLARLARQVWRAQQADPDFFDAAREEYQQAASRLYNSPDGQSALALACWIVGRITQVAGRDITTTCTGGHRS